MISHRLMAPFVTFLLFLAACGGQTTSTAVLPTPPAYTTPVPSIDIVINSYLDALRVEDYNLMYDLLSSESRTLMAVDQFTSIHSEAFIAMGVTNVDYAIYSTLTNPTTAQVAYQITYETSLLGDIKRDITSSLVLEDGNWRVVWNHGMILPELAGGKTLVSYYDTPGRGNIYDRNGEAIAIEAEAYSLGLISGGITEEFVGALFQRLERLTSTPITNFETNYYAYNDGLYVPVGEALISDVEKSGVLGFEGIYAVPYTSRFYTPEVAGQVVGHLQFISTEEMTTYRRLGYSGAERVGVHGIELWAEDILHGRNGVTLFIASPEKNPESVLIQTESEPSSSITLTLDAELQSQAQRAMDGLPGAIVVMEVDTGRVLAMVSSPAVDTNWYDPKNYNFSALGNALSTPNIELNRASQGQYPLGSVFKIVTMAAALESGLFTPDTVYSCPYEYTEIPNIVLTDWTWQRCVDEMIETGNNTCSWPNSQPSGDLTLVEGLMRSCDPWFYHIGYNLYTAGLTTAISEMSKGFGLGQVTNIQQVEEESGNVPLPTDGLNATSLAIGQGNMLVTPLQVVDFIAAIANGGTLYRPQLVENIQPATGNPIQVFKPEARGTLPISEDTLAAIQEGMRLVTENRRGTAYARLGTFAIPTSGKTGTAESGTIDPQAWFAGFSRAGNPNKPDIAVVVLVEKQGEGSIWALPIFRRVMEIYFFGSPQTLYPWETTFGVIDPEYGIIVPATSTPVP